jgi:transposase
MRSDLLAMTPKELSRLAAMHRLEAGAASQAEIAAELKLGLRQIKRLWQRYRTRGEAGLVSGHRTHPSNRRGDPAQRERALTLVREHYADFGPTLAAEKLRARHGIAINRESLRQAMTAAGLWSPDRHRRRVVHLPRERRARFGELVQIDGSPHPWFEKRGPRCTLLVFIDDATSRIVALHFTTAETTASYFMAARQYFERFGLPQAFYSDRFSVFRVNADSIESSETTQFGRAMDDLGIELICANSPQAKGRVERANRTLQDRLVKELRIAGIADINTANDFVKNYIESHNERFAVAPRDERDAHRPVAQHERLGRILAPRRSRRLSKAMLFQHDNAVYHVTTTQRRLVFPRALVDVIDAPDGTILVERDGALLDFELVTRKQPAAVHSAKSLTEHLDRRHRQPRNDPKKAHVPPRNHPWRHTPVSTPRPTGHAPRGPF